MSKRQEKIERRKAEQQEFLSARRIQQLGMLQRAYDVGLKLYEDNKDRLTPEEIEQIEKMKAEQLSAIEKVRAELGELNPNPQT